MWYADGGKYYGEMENRVENRRDGKGVERWQLNRS